MTLDRTQAPHVQDAVEFDYVLPPINTTILRNGIKLYWLNAGVQDVAEIDLVFPAGLWYEQKPAIAHAAAGLVKNGTAAHTAQQINEAFEFYGAHIKISAGNDYATITLHTLTRHLPHLLPVIYEMICGALFPDAEVEIHKQNAVQRLLVNLRQGEFVANQRIDAMLFGETHPYGRFSRRESIEALQRNDLVSFFQSRYALAGATIFMAGRVGDGEVACINRVFGEELSSMMPHTDTVFAPAPPIARQDHVINDPNGVQSAIRIGRLFPNRQHSDYAPMVVLNTLFGGYFGSRLMSNIREDKGYTYGIYSSVTPYVHGGSLTIQAEVGRDVADAAIKETYFEMERLCTDLAGEEELLLVKNYLLGGLLGDLDGPFSILQRWKTLILNGFDASRFDENVAVYKEVTAGQLRDLAQKYFNKADFYEVAVV